MNKTKVSAKVLDKDKNPTGLLVDITDKIEYKLEIDRKIYYYSYSHGYYIEDDEDVPF
jgi:hypothetical protein